MKTIGLIPSQQIVSLLEDGEGDYLDVPQGQTVVPLVESPKPAISAGVDYTPKIVWFEDRAERQWDQISVTPPPAPAAERYKVLEYLMRHSIPLDSIPGMIASVTEEGVERDVAIMRWHEIPTFPKEHPLVTAVAAQLNLNLDEVWGSILAIE